MLVFTTFATQVRSIAAWQQEMCIRDRAKAARAYAFIRRRGYVIPEDVRAVCHDVLRHRIGLTYEAEAENITTEQIITDILNNVIVP